MTSKGIGSPRPRLAYARSAAVLLAASAGAARATVASADERPVQTVAAAETARSAQTSAKSPESAFPQSPLAPAYLDLLERYLDLMQKFTRLAEDPAAAGISSVFGSKEMFASEGDPSKAIEFFNGVLPDVKNDAIRRAIRIQLIDLYKKSGQRDKAVEQMRILITTAPPEEETHDSQDARGAGDSHERHDRRDAHPATDAPPAHP